MSFAIIVPTRDFPAGMFHEFSLRDCKDGFSSGEIAVGRDFEFRIADFEIIRRNVFPPTYYSMP